MCTRLEINNTVQLYERLYFQKQKVVSHINAHRTVAREVNFLFYLARRFGISPSTGRSLRAPCQACGRTQGFAIYGCVGPLQFFPAPVHRLRFQCVLGQPRSTWPWWLAVTVAASFATATGARTSSSYKAAAGLTSARRGLINSWAWSLFSGGRTRANKAAFAFTTRRDKT